MFSGIVYSMCSSSLYSTGLEALISVKSSSHNSFGVVSISSWFLQDSYLKNASPHPTFYAIFIVSFMIPLIGSLLSPLKWWKTSGQNLSPVGIYYFRSDSFHDFFCSNNGNFSGEVLSDFHDVLSSIVQRQSFPSITVYHEALM